MVIIQRFEPVRVGKRGTITIPAALRQQYRLEEGSILVFEPREEGILLRPACVYPLEIYTPERKAEFLLNNAVTPEDYAWAVEEVRKI
ncbi:MAG: AbrB/MazE/SpoVT family DNA-binding domain-containing protein [Thermanaeromonas sp.]|uniref:AbrB/MazE/SpoVT family DNA-binding domain-containing protein n=1 Tax=Thermanaeromonas sp. TaxID=2003697 RepID=UPI00243E3B5D|nr:AbrB/MazE/SpoVT family DNA-binding domain-containing protein [Thermanaeromonas sp.]MCG0277937.1 AbrB/MazE/SpoVT family DNA-binding domain-containing protein [Thermanaeromonas sp.]